MLTTVPLMELMKGELSKIYSIYTLKNLVPNPSFESNTDWSSIVYATDQKIFGIRSQKFNLGTSIATCPMIKPIVNHVYYGRHYLKSNGNNVPADCRFEWFAGDGPGLNFVFGLNRGNWPAWEMESSIIKTTEVKGANYICRNFVVNGTAEMWTDGLMIVDLTAAFGSGNEPAKEWCDTIPFFESTFDVYGFQQESFVLVSILPNPVQANTAFKLTTKIESGTKYGLPEMRYCGQFYSGEV